MTCDALKNILKLIYKTSSIANKVQLNHWFIFPDGMIRYLTGHELGIGISLLAVRYKVIHHPLTFVVNNARNPKI
jgi:hypothetical protein